MITRLRIGQSQWHCGLPEQNTATHIKDQAACEVVGMMKQDFVDAIFLTDKLFGPKSSEVSMIEGMTW